MRRAGESLQSVREAFEELKEWKPDVLISDIGMPEEDGYELIRKGACAPLKQGGQVLAVALTAYARQEDRERALSPGYQVHLPKPVEPNELVVSVASLTDKKE